MTKKVPDIIITCRIGNLVFYKMNGKGYVRLESSLTGKQFKKKKCFEGSRRSAERFGTGNKLASAVYKSLPLQQRHYSLFCLLKSKAIALLKEGHDVPTTILHLEQLIQTLEQEMPAKNNRQTSQSKSMQLIGGRVQGEWEESATRVQGGRGEKLKISGEKRR